MERTAKTKDHIWRRWSQSFSSTNSSPPWNALRDRQLTWHLLCRQQYVLVHAKQQHVKVRVILYCLVFLIAQSLQRLSLPFSALFFFSVLPVDEAQVSALLPSARKQRRRVIRSLQAEMSVVFLFLFLFFAQSGGVRSDRKWSVEMQVVAHVNARWKHTRLELSACDRITQDGC